MITARAEYILGKIDDKGAVAALVFELDATLAAAAAVATTAAGGKKK